MGKTDGLESLLGTSREAAYIRPGQGPSYTAFRGDPDLRKEILQATEGVVTVWDAGEAFGVEQPTGNGASELGSITGLGALFWKTLAVMHCDEPDRVTVHEILQAIPACSELRTREGESTWARNLSVFCLGQIKEMGFPDCGPEWQGSLQAAIYAVSGSAGPDDIKLLEEAETICTGEIDDAREREDDRSEDMFQCAREIFYLALHPDEHDLMPRACDIFVRNLDAEETVRYRDKVTNRFVEILQSLPVVTLREPDQKAANED